MIYGLEINDYKKTKKLHHRREEQFQKRGRLAAFRKLYFIHFSSNFINSNGIASGWAALPIHHTTSSSTASCLLLH